MKLHHLTFEGIGPFRERVALDFNALGQSGIFLLEGATGSGKSTIIDAIVFALYGDVAGGESSKNRIRSDFMPNTKESFVELAFEVPSGLYRVRRTPQYMRAAQRGNNKEVNQNATAHLWKYLSADAFEAAIDGSERASATETLASKPADVSVLVQEAIGLSHDQFTQTVVLPQGEFARFLRADTKDRKKVLEKVFGTQFYQRIEDSFAEARKVANHAVETSVRGLREKYTRLLEAAALTDEQHREEIDSVGSFTATALERASERASELAEAALAAKNHAAVEMEQAHRAVESAEAVHGAAIHTQEILAERQKLDARIAERDQRAEAVGIAQQRYAKHTAAEKPFYAVKQEELAAAKLHEARENLPEELRGDSEAWVMLATEHGAKARELSEKAAELKAAVEIENNLPKLAEELERLRAEHKKHGENKVELRLQLDNRPAEREKIVSAHESAAQLAGSEPDARAQYNAAIARFEAAQKALTAEQGLEVLKEQVTAAIVKATEAVRVESSLRQQRLDSIAYEIAGKLEAGEPCPVCGSIEHPHPAKTSEEPITPERIEIAQKARQAVEETVSELRAKTSALEATIEHERAAAFANSDTENNGPAADVSTADLAKVAADDREQASEKLAKAAAAKTAREQAEQQLAEFDTATRAIEESISKAEVQAERQATTIESLDKSHAENSEKVKEAKDGAASVAQRQIALIEESRSHERLAGLLSTAEQARERHLETSAQSRDFIAESPFDDAEQVKRARLSDVELQQLTAHITAFSNLESVITEALKNPEVAKAEASSEALQQAGEAARSAKESLDSARAAYTKAASDHDWAEKTAERTFKARETFVVAVRAHSTSMARQTEVVHLADVATGNSRDTTARLTLSTYAVMRRFESVVAAANTRLATLSSGDYEIHLAEPSKAGNKQVGLDLQVIDRRNDKSREPKTLSGGETFYVSLALALGLADIVSAESGGIHMDTLFIDEGFGSLDPEKLDGVLGEIRALAQHGRTVGIVSHVADLKAQIAEKIHVERTVEGTSIAKVTV